MAELDAGIFQVGPEVSSGPAQRVFLDRLRQVALESGRPVMFGTISTRQGEAPNSYRYQLDYLDRSIAAGARMFGQTTTKSINAIFALKSYLPFDVLPHWKELRALPVEEQKRRMADPAVRAQLVADEDRMKPRDNVFQGGGAATTDPRKPDYTNLFAMSDVEWNDPTVASLAAERGKHPVEVMLDLMLANEDQVFVQPLVNEGRDDVLDMLRHPWTLTTFSDSGAHVCQEMGSSLQTHMLSYWVRARQAFTLEQAVRKLTLRQRGGVGIERSRPGADRLRRRPGVVRRAHGAPDDAGGGGRSAGRRPAVGAEGGGHRRHDRQRPGGVREWRRDG